MRHLLLAGVLTIGSLGLLLSGCKDKNSGHGAEATGSEIPIGEYGSMTGDTATFGQSTHNGIQLAVDQTNAAGGVLGKQIKLITEDDQSKTDEAVSAVQKLINRDKVVAILGEVASKRSLAAGGVCQKYGIPMLSPSSTNPAVTQVGDCIFRACFTDDFQGLVGAQFAAKRNWKKIAILTDVNNDYSKGLAKFFRQGYEGKGDLVSDESYREGDRDFKAQLTRIKGTNPDAVYAPGYYTDIGLILRQARELGITVPFFGGDGWDSPDTLKLGSVVDGCFYTNHCSIDDPRPSLQKLVADYRAKYNTDPDAMAITGYDAAMLLFDAIKRAGHANSSDIKTALANTKDFPASTGPMTIDPNRNALKPIVILEIEHGKQIPVESITPQ
ncbi:MAG TPA: ABC transporter substrate-binding protein [Tepidisphaeraceae bacterium]|jgi:branched-chain amino acid transport system substrate-binding protein|nr:ABC transporter substrate-binding protein [Tepidisphaeraceae bacterium]